MTQLEFSMSDSTVTRLSILDQLPLATPLTNHTTNSDSIQIQLEINGAPYALTVDPRASLLDVLREYLGLTGTKKGCDHGQCGACTVLVNGQRINACLTLAVSYDQDSITTIEGLAQGDSLHPVQAAFLACDGFQCGYCTPGQIMSAVGLLNEGHARTEDEIREQMSGNLCRCGAYVNILAAIQEAKNVLVDATGSSDL